MFCKELLNYKYDHSATHTRSRVEFMKDKKGICFDFVNYIYYKLDKKPSCYFIYGNKNNNTHTFCILDSTWIEYAWQNKIGEHRGYTVQDVAKEWIKQHNGNNPDVFLVKYRPNNNVMSIKEFCEDKFSYPDSRLIDIKGE